GAFGAGHVFFVLGAAGATAAATTEQACPTTPAAAATSATTTAAVVAGDVEIRAGEIGNFDDQILDRIDPREHILVCQLARGHFDHALIDVIRQRRSRASFIQNQIEQLSQRDAP